MTVNITRKKLVVLTLLLISMFASSPVAAVAGVWSSNGNNMYYTDGNIGIGTSSPAARLDVSGYVKSKVSSNGGATFVVAPNSGTQSYGMTSLNEGGFFFGRTAGVGSGVEDDIYIRNNGNVGVNTASPSTNFEVNGDVKSKVSTNGGATYVLTSNDGLQSYGMTAINGGGFFLGKTGGPGQGVAGSIRIYADNTICLGNC